MLIVAFLYIILDINVKLWETLGHEAEYMYVWHFTYAVPIHRPCRNKQSCHGHAPVRCEQIERCALGVRLR